MAAVEDVIGCIWLSHKCIFYPVRNWKTVWQARPDGDNSMWLSKDKLVHDHAHGQCADTGGHLSQPKA